MDPYCFISCFIFSFFLVPILRAALDELPTILQIIKRAFATERKDLKKAYGPWAVVTGCTNGIGKYYSFELAERGLNLVLVGRSREKLDAVSAEIRSKHQVDTKIVVADFKRGREIYRAIREEVEELDVGILVNNVGIQYSYPMYFGEVPEDEVWDSLNVNLGSAVQMTRMILPKMVERSRGAIVNLSSGSKLQPIPFMNLYAAAKVFIDRFTDALRIEYRNSNITFQSLCPYYVNTNINNFSDELQRVGTFIPDADVYARSAIDTLGYIDNTTGYWPHRFQYFLYLTVPIWIKTYIAGKRYKRMRNIYLKNLVGSPISRC